MHTYTHTTNTPNTDPRKQTHTTIMHASTHAYEHAHSQMILLDKIKKRHLHVVLFVAFDAVWYNALIVKFYKSGN